VLLWSTEDPPIPSGTVLPVYIRSNIEKIWVVGVPEGYHSGTADKIEIPLSRLELAGNKKKANTRAGDFAQYALTYAENMQDGLPIREHPDNNARRVYRLRLGEIVQILSFTDGIPAISATGDPLPGEWYRILTEDGTIGFCFSYRLNFFEYAGGPLAASVPVIHEILADPDLDMLMSRTWSHESYSAMINQRRLNLNDLSNRWHFDPGQDTGTARIYAPGIDRSFFYTSIRPDGQRAWRFEGSNLLMQLRSDTTLAVQYLETSGSMRTLLFVSLPVDVNDLIIQETTRQERLYEAIYNQGPVFTSNNYGTITFNEDGSFSWIGYDLLVPMHISENASGDGTVSMDLFLAPELEHRYNGAFTMSFRNLNNRITIMRCMFSLDNQGFRIEIVPETSIDGITVTQRAASPMVMYFFKDEGLW
jgi:hypothetical protein